LKSFRHDSPYSPPPTTFQVEPLFDVFRKRERGFDYFTIEIHNIESAVGANGKIDRPKPIIGGGQEFAIRCGSLGYKRGPLLNEQVAVHKIVGRVADETIAAIRFGQKVRSINNRTAGRSDIASGHQLRRGVALGIGGFFAASGSLYAPSLERTDPKYFACRSMVRDI
jgi:hypothetical protein